MKPKTKSSKPTCPYARFLRHMPPLVHHPNPGGAFYVANSNVIRFIVFAMGHTAVCSKSRSAAMSVFHEARKSRVIIAKPGIGGKPFTWRGRSYVKGNPSPVVRTVLGKMWAARASEKPVRDKGKN